MDLTHRPRTTMIKIEDSNYRTMVSSHGAGRVLQTINKHIITFQNTKSVKTKPLRWGNVRVLFTVKEHLYLYLSLTTTYDYIL